MLDISAPSFFLILFGFVGICSVGPCFQLFFSKVEKNESEALGAFFLFFIILLLSIFLYPIGISEITRGLPREESLIDSNGFYQTLGQPYCWSESGESKCLVILQKSDMNTKLFLVEGKKSTDFPKFFIWRKDASGKTTAEKYGRQD